MKTIRKQLFALALAGACAGAAWAQDAAKAVYDAACAACHATGVLGAPKPGDAAAWGPRTQGGMDALLKRAIAGTDKGMPPRGGRADLNDAQLRAVIEYMVRGGAPAAAAAPAPAAAAPVPAVARPGAAAEVNAFNRLLKPLGRFNRPAVDSGIHDPANDMTLQLQPPATAFATLPKSMAGNHVDWVKALDGKAIAPRWDRNDPAAAAVVMDLNIVREVKGSMPDVVYPHKQHTEWLDCANCHPAIFVPQKGANQISMASILLGQKCGVCHGKVAFPVSECRLCHSRKKTEATTAEAKK
ncbi:MAG: c-type cytochrome [Rubrivivax sp.]|nr:c-type cytochrome [Rubrivivax sp.]